MLDQITPVLLTYNEAPNIARTLAKLSWARQIIVVDSFSTDATAGILKSDPRVRMFQRKFDSHAAQWNHAVQETGVVTPWVLALDADYVLSGELVSELGALSPDSDTAAYRARFDYYVRGKRLWGSLYPPVTVLFRKDRGSYEQDGHTQRLRVFGAVGTLSAPIAHDDRKPFSHWRVAQRRYCRLEAQKLWSTPWRRLGWPDRVRRLIVVAPFAVPCYCLFLRGAILQGLPGWQYVLQRAWNEAVLSSEILSLSLRGLSRR